MKYQYRILKYSYGWKTFYRYEFKTTPQEDREIFIKTHCPERPPIGNIPEWMWVEERVRQLTEIIEAKHNQECEDLIEDWSRHANWLMRRNQVTK